MVNIRQGWINKQEGWINKYEEWMYKWKWQMNKWMKRMKRKNIWICFKEFYTGFCTGEDSLESHSGKDKKNICNFYLHLYSFIRMVIL